MKKIGITQRVVYDSFSKEVRDTMITGGMILERISI